MDGLVTESGRYLLTQGILGVVALAEAAVIIALWRSLSKCQEARIEAVSELALECTRCIVNSTQATALSTAATEGQNKLSESRVVAFESMASAFKDLREEVRRK